MAEVREFKYCVEACGLQDLRSSGSYCTWNNKQQGSDRVYSKIDRVLTNYECIMDIPASEVYFVNEGLFDHCPAIIN